MLFPAPFGPNKIVMPFDSIVRETLLIKQFPYLLNETEQNFIGIKSHGGLVSG